MPPMTRAAIGFVTSTPVFMHWGCALWAWVERWRQGRGRNDLAASATAQGGSDGAEPSAEDDEEPRSGSCAVRRRSVFFFFFQRQLFRRSPICARFSIGRGQASAGSGCGGRFVRGGPGCLSMELFFLSESESHRRPWGAVRCDVRGTEFDGNRLCAVNIEC
jgi:hypothetical protein